MKQTIKNKTKLRIGSLLLVVYFAGINLNLGFIEVVLDLLLMIFVFEALTRKPKKKEPREKKIKRRPTTSRRIRRK